METKIKKFLNSKMFKNEVRRQLDIKILINNNDKVMFDPITGTQIKTAPKDSKIIKAHCLGRTCVCVCNHNIIFMGVFTINTNIDHYAPRNWQLSENIIYCDDNCYQIKYGSIIKCDYITVQNLTSIIYRAYYYADHCINFTRNLTKYFGEFLVTREGGGSKINGLNWNISDLFLKGEPHPKLGKRQEEINLLNKNLSPLKWQDFYDGTEENIDIPYWYCETNKYSKSVIEEVTIDNSIYTVFRIIYVTKDTLIETKRIVCDNTGKILFACRKNNRNEWVSTTKHYKHVEVKKVYNTNLLAKYSHCQFLGDLTQLNLEEILTIVEHPIAEVLYKSPLSNIVKNHFDDFNRFICNKDSYFGDTSKECKNIYQFLGMNKYQINMFVNCYKTWMANSKIPYFRKESMIKYIKQVFLSNNIKDIDNNTFKTVFDVVDEQTNSGYEYYNCWSVIDRIKQAFHNTPLYQGTLEKERRLNLALCKIFTEGQYDVYNIIYDCIDLVRSMPYTRPAMDIFNDIWKNHRIKEIRYIHDTLIQENARQQQRRQECRDLEYATKFKARAKELENFLFKDEKYIIRTPISASELECEGIKQHICIGSYVNRYSDGYTNLFLLRDKIYPKIPLLAIEVDNNNKLVQIHGKYNAWIANCAKEAIPTILVWLRDNNISYDKTILTNTSDRYWSSGADYLSDEEFNDMVEKSYHINNIYNKEEQNNGMDIIPGIAL